MSDDMLRSIALLLTQEAFRQNRGWDYQGVWANVRRALDEDGRTARQVITAGYSAIDDPKAVTPGAIRWADRYKMLGGGPQGLSATGPRCGECDRVRAVHDAAEAKVPIHARHAFRTAESTPEKSNRPHASAAEVTR